MSASSRHDKSSHLRGFAKSNGSYQRGALEVLIITLLVVVLDLSSSEALATSFVPNIRNSFPRGGATRGAETATRSTMECVLQASPGASNDVMSVNGSGESENRHQQPHTNNKKAQKHLPVGEIGGPLIASSSTETQFAMDDPVVQAEFVAETNLPTDIGHFRLRAYRVSQKESNCYGGTEPCVIYCTNKPPFAGSTKSSPAQAVPVRIHDQCFTSEVFRSQRCDCKEQLKMSLEYIQKHGGVVIYLQQEGRGIGLANKVAAYALQDVGMDTVDANLHLGFPEDMRQYGAVPSILRDLNIGSIKLLTNNPRKIDRLEAVGVTVLGTVPMVVEQANPYNRKYLETKQERMNHMNFGRMLSASPSSALSSGYVPQVDTLVTKTSGLAPKSVAITTDEYINGGGKDMAAAAVAMALMEGEGESGRTGVVAKEDGYCFGRKSVEDAIEAIKVGELVVVVDDEDRENEGDFIMAADLVTPEAMATIVRYSSGVICVAMEAERMDELLLPPMVTNNEDPKGTAFSITVDAAKSHGITTGISATDRAKTVQLLASPTTAASDFVRPGHIFPLKARQGGTLTRGGHTEASVDLPRLAGLNPCGVLCELVSEENPTEMARLPELERFCKKHGYKMTSIVDIAQYRRDTGQ